MLPTIDIGGSTVQRCLLTGRDADSVSAVMLKKNNLSVSRAPRSILWRGILMPVLTALLLAISSIGSSAVYSQQTPAGDTQLLMTPEHAIPNLDQLDAARKAVESDAALNEMQKKKALEFFDQAVKWIEAGNTAKDELSGLKNLITAAPGRIEQIRQQLARPTRDSGSVESITEETNLDQLELIISQEKLDVAQTREEIKSQEDELARILVSSKNLSEEIENRLKRIEQLETDLRTAVPNEPPALTQARIFALRSRLALRQTELETFKLRLGSLNLLTTLAQSEKNLLQSQLARRESRLAARYEVVQRARETRARVAREEAETLKQQAVELPSAIQTIARENAGYRTELEELVGKEKSVVTLFDAARKRLQEINSDFERTRQRVDVVGQSASIGKMLRHRREGLPSLQNYRRTSSQRSAEINRATDRQLDIDESLRERSNIQRIEEQVLASLPPAIPANERTKISNQAIDLARARRDSLNELQNVYGLYISRLTALDLAERQLVEVSRAFIDYIDDQLLWIPSSEIKALADSRRWANALVWFLSPGNWAQLTRDVWILTRDRPGTILVLIGLFALLWKNRRKARTQLIELARHTTKIRSDSFGLTLKALGLSLVIVGALPLLMIGIGWLLKQMPASVPFTVTVASGLFNGGSRGSASTLAETGQGGCGPGARLADTRGCVTAFSDHLVQRRRFASVGTADRSTRVRITHDHLDDIRVPFVQRTRRNYGRRKAESGEQFPGPIAFPLVARPGTSTIGPDGYFHVGLPL